MAAIYTNINLIEYNLILNLIDGKAKKQQKKTHYFEN